MSQLSMSPNRASYHRGNSPASTISEDEESNNSEPNDLRTAQKSRHPGGGFGFSSFYSPPQSHGGSGSSGHSGGSGGHPQPQYVATNECRLIDYRGARIAAFLAANRQGEYLLCLPQAFELFLKHLVGGLHTVYTKLKRLDIVPIVCNVEQVRILRGLGAIQPGVNRCKLLSTHDFDVLYKDCTTARPGRPPKRSSGIPSPEPGNYGSSASLGNNQPSSNNLLPLLGFPNTKKARYSDECDFGNENLDLKQLNSGNVNLSSSANSAATAAAMLAANGYSAAFPFLQHLSAAANSMPNSQQHQQLVAAAAALGLPALPNRSPPPGVHPQTTHFSGNSGNSSTGGGNNAATPENPDFNPTAAYLWLLSQQQQHLPSAAAAAAALNLSSRGVPTNSFVNGSSNGASGNNGSHLSVNNSNASAHLSGGINTGSGGNSTSDIDKHGLISGSGKERSATKNHSSGVSAEHHRTLNGSTANGSLSSHNTGTLRKPSKDEEDEEEDETTDDEDDEVESNHSSRHSDNPVSSTGFNGTAASNPRGFLENVTSLRHNVETPPSVPNQGQTPPEHCLETLLRNIEGLLAIAAHNARQQQTQLQLQKAEIRAEYSSQLERERELREHVEKQLHEEQKIRIIYQKRFKKERKLRRKLEIELQQSPVSQQQLSQSLNLSSSTNKHHQQQQRSPLSQANGTASSATLTPVSSNTKSPANSLPPTPPPQNASSDEAD